MLFQAEPSKVFEIFGLFNSEDAVNKAMSGRSDVGVIVVYTLADKSPLIVACSFEESKCQTGDVVLELTFTESGKAVPIAGSNIQLEKFKNKMK